MTADVGTETETRAGSSGRAFTAAFERPCLLAGLALSLFALCLAGGFLLMPNEPVRAVVEVVRLDLDRDASGPASLVRIAPLSIESERSAILAERLIEDALAKAESPTQPSRNEERPGDFAALSTAVLDHLRVDEAARSNELDIVLPARVADTPAAIVNSVAARYVELRNQERRQQKEQALVWADNKLAYWQGAIEILKSDAEDAPERAPPFETDERRLLDLLMEATRTAQADTLSRIRSTFSVTDDGRRDLSIEILEHDYARLTQDLERLETVVSEAGRAAPSAGETANLTETEEKLSLFKQDLDALISSGLLESPAAKVIAPAIERPPRALQRWPVLIPAAAAASLILAWLLTLGATRWGSSPRAASAGAEVLSNPYWPMTPQQYLEESRALHGPR